MARSNPVVSLLPPPPGLSCTSARMTGPGPAGTVRAAAIASDGGSIGAANSGSASSHSALLVRQGLGRAWSGA